MTTLDFLRNACHVCGLIDLAAEELEQPMAQLALQFFQGMLSSWSLEKLLIFQTGTIPITLVPGTAVYTIGSGGMVNVARPVRIDHAICRFPIGGGGIDYAVEILQREEDYDNIALKSVGNALIQSLFFDPSYPLAEVRLYPTPTQAILLTLTADFPLMAPVAMATELSFPEGYEEAFRWNLGLRLGEAFGRGATPVLIGLAQSSRAAIMNAHMQTVRARLDPRLASIGSGHHGADPAWIYRGGA